MGQYLENKPPSKEHLQKCVDFFHENGYLVIPNVLTPKRCQELRDDLDRDIAQHPELNNRKYYFSHRMFERSQANLNLFELEPMISFAEKLIGEANGQGMAKNIGIPNSNTIHVIHNNSFVVLPKSPGLANSSWHQDDSPHILSLDGKPIKNVRLNVLAFTINFYLTDVLKVENGCTQVVPGSHLFGKVCPSDVRGYKIDSCLAPIGSVVCFNNQVWHRGAPNLSNRPRYITQITYGKRLVGHKYYPFMNYQMPEHCYKNASPRLKTLLGFLPNGAYG
ncbi:phytanoyl-CoA dioxygenase family protein [Hyella patelloides]|nr:phytanoyl-CoA dioxygenase family protein [Hyella patelloides]